MLKPILSFVSNELAAEEGTMGPTINYETLLSTLPLIAILRLAAGEPTTSAPSNPAAATAATIPVST